MLNCPCFVKLQPSEAQEVNDWMPHNMVDWALLYIELLCSYTIDCVSVWV